MGPPQWPLPKGFQYQEGWKPPTSWPVVEGWEFWRHPTGARESVSLENAEFFAKLFNRHGATPLSARADRDIAQMAGEVLLSDHEFPKTHKSLLVLSYYRDSAANLLYALVWKRDSDFLCLCCYQDMHQASLEFEVRTNTDDLESHLSLGFPLGGLPDRVATPAARLDTRNWLWAAAEVQKATTCFWLARADRSDYEETIIATSRRKEARLRRWVEALRTGELPDPLSVPRPTAHDPSDWQAAEALAAVALQHMGWKDAALTQAGADSGIDVLGRHVAAQVKHQTMPVGRPVLQRLVGAGRGKELACFSKSGFSRQAMNFADEEGIALFEIELPASVAATNDAAREWLKSWEN